MSRPFCNISDVK